MSVSVKDLNKRIEELRKRGVPEEQIQASVNRLQQQKQIDTDTLPERVASGIIKPFTDFGRSAVAIGAGGAGLVQGALGDKEGMTSSARKAYEILTPEQREAFTGTAGDATIQGIRQGAGLAPYVLPAGNTVKQAFGLGAAGGASRAIYDTQGENLEDTAKSAVAGAIGGGLFSAGLFKAGQILKNAKSKSSGLRGVNPQAGSGPKSIIKEEEMQKIANELGLKGSPDQKRRQIAALYDQYADEISSILDGSGKKIGSRQIQDIIEETAPDNINYNQFSKTQQKYLQEEVNKIASNAKGNKVDASDIFEYKMKLGGELKNAFRKLSGELNTGLTAKESAKLAVWESLDDVITGLEPNVKQLTLNQSTLHRLAPGLEKLSNETYRLPIVNVPVGTGGARGAMDFVGRALDAPKGVMGAAGDVLTNQTVQRVSQPVMSQVGSQLFTGSFPQKEQIDVQQPIDDLNTEFENQRNGVPTRDNQITNQMVSQGQLPQNQAEIYPQQPQTQQQNPFGNLTKQQVLQKAIQAGADYGDLQKVSAYYDMLVPEQNNIGIVQQAISQGVGKQQFLQAAAAQGADMSKLQEFSSAYDILQPEGKEDKAAEGGMRAVDRLMSLHGTIEEQGLTAQSGGITGRLGGVRGSYEQLTQNTPYAAAYDSAREGLLAKIARASGEVGTLNEQDVKRAKKNIPSFYDSPDVAAEKFRTLQSIMQSIEDDLRKEGYTWEDF